MGVPLEMEYETTLAGIVVPGMTVVPGINPEIQVGVLVKPENEDAGTVVVVGTGTVVLGKRVAVVHPGRVTI